MLSRSFPKIKCISEGLKPLKLPDNARQIGMASVPYFFENWEQKFKPQKRIFKTDLKNKFIAEIINRAAGRPIIGISWRSARLKLGPHKSMPLDYWREILENRDALFINRQYGETDIEIADAIKAFGADIYSFPRLDYMNDLDNLTSLIDSLDLVITTSNVTAHFSGGLGKKCWLALQKVPLWYWGAQGKTNKFYPSITIYRQNEPNNWSSLITEISTDLTTFLN